ncbi:MAG: hypothetical protein ACI4D8_08775 [Wujia sp.]
MAKDKKKLEKGMLIFLVVSAWIFFGLLVVVFYFFFFDKLPRHKNSSNTEVAASDDSDSVFIYKTNSNMEINALISDYYSGIVSCDQQLLKSIVTNPEQFDDMTEYEKTSKKITGYTNINCYSVSGYSSDATLVYVTSNVLISGINSTPMDIKKFYVRFDGVNYKIFNGSFSDEELAYIEKIQAEPDIQNLYKDVLENLNYCLENDPSLKELYDMIIQ